MMNSPDTHIKLSELTQQIRSVIDAEFAEKSYWIVAEISSHKMYLDGDRHYFEFVEKDEDTTTETAKIRGIAWRQGSASIRLFESATGQQFKDGIEVLVQVKVEYQSKYGIQLILLDIDQNWTLGNLEKQRQATLARLLRENPDAIQLVDEEYITTNKNARLKMVIQNIAIIGSPNSAGYRDFLGIIESNRFSYKFMMDNYQSSVQGAEAHSEIVNRLISIFRSGKKYDCVVIIRGGGAKTDFLVFDNYLLAKAVARFPIPIIAGIGHTTDNSIVDMMANTSVNSPTKAAEFIVSHNRHFEEVVYTLHKQVTVKSQQLLANAISRIANTNLSVINKTRTILTRNKDGLNRISHVLATRPMIVVSHRIQNLENLLSNMKSFSKKYFLNLRGYVGHYDSMIRMAKPESILKRGFAIVKKEGKPIGSAKSIKSKDKLMVVMHKYDIDTQVITKHERDDGESYL